MKRKNKLIGFLLILIGILSYLGMAIASKLEHKEEVNNTIITLQEFKYISLDGSTRSLEKGNVPNVIFFFNPECEHCQAEAKLVSEHVADFEKAKVYFFSTEEIESIKKFAQDYKLETFEVGQVDYMKVAYPMGVNTFPMCFIYSPEGKLLKQFKGEVKIEAITNYLK